MLFEMKSIWREISSWSDFPFYCFHSTNGKGSHSNIPEEQIVGLQLWEVNSDPTLGRKFNLNGRTRFL